MHREAGTGYHQPQGIVLRSGSGVQPNDGRTRIESIAIRPMILKDLGIDETGVSVGLSLAVAGWHGSQIADHQQTRADADERHDARDRAGVA